MEHIKNSFKKQLENRWKISKSTADERIEKLEKLRNAILKRREELHQAIFEDFKKHPTESDLTEIFPVITELNHTLRHLKSWMKPKRVRTPLILLGTRSEIYYEARGLVLVLSPWNYPFALSVNPVVTAMASGNCVILKPSSKVPKTAWFLKSLFSELFSEEEVMVIEGTHAVSDLLLTLPFDHIFFTGSPRVGTKVMKAAAKNLATVTLELGGKSPVIVDESANVPKAVERILWGKFINAGQTCVAPDYLLIHEKRIAEFLDESKRVLGSRFGETESSRSKNESFCRIVSEDHLIGLKNKLDEAVQWGGQIEVGGVTHIQNRYLSPTLISGITKDSPLMREEIFGPILPIVSFSELKEALALIQAKSKPLALYIFSENEKAIKEIMANTSAGGTCINSLILHLANNNLPFGGVGQSGMGHYHGWHGFKSLSHERAVLRQGRIDILKYFYPPYTAWIKKLSNLVLRFFT